MPEEIISGNNGHKEEEKEFELKIVWKEQGIALAGNCVKNEMVALYLLDKARDIIKQLNKPQIAKASSGVGGFRNFLRGKR